MKVIKRINLVCAVFWLTLRTKHLYIIQIIFVIRKIKPSGIIKRKLEEFVPNF